MTERCQVQQCHNYAETDYRGHPVCNLHNHLFLKDNINFQYARWKVKK